MLRSARTLALLATIAVPLACRTVTDPLPPQAALNFDITDSALSSQRAPLPAPQVVSWRVDELSASEVSGFDGTYSFLFAGPCSYQLNAAAPFSFVQSCRTSGLTLKPGTISHGAIFRLRISKLEVRAAARPDLTAPADPDGDGVPNETDNCPIVPNPDQKNTNAGQGVFDVGDACFAVNDAGEFTFPDQDRDGVSDAVDNCLWYPNPAAPGEIVPTDTDKDGSGDACERNAPVILPNGSLTVECDNVDFTTVPSVVSFFRLDFGRPGVLTCDAGFTGCTIDPSALKLTKAGSTSTFDCHSVP
jgi:hypothetical protein